MELLTGLGTRNRIHAALDKLPEKLPDAYEEVMERIDRQAEDQRTMAVTALTWITHAKERLTVDVLLHAIAVCLEPKRTDVNEHDLVDVELLLSSCMGLVIVNKEDRVIRLVHFTTQDYLKTRFPSVDANTSIAGICLTYLGFDMFSDPPETKDALKDLMDKYALSGYAARCWGDHAREGREEEIEQLILSTLRTQEKRDMIARFDKFRPYYLLGEPARFSCLHLFSIYGLSRLCSTLLNQDVVLLVVI
jgi:hypothetical protein